MKYQEHTLPPVYDSRSRVLMLGSFPSPKSRSTGFYYGHPQNRFWKALSAALDEPLPLTNEEKRALVLRRHIALWDVVASCEIAGASDARIRSARPNDFSLILSASPVRAVFTVGKTAERLYERFTGRTALCLPSPSPANCALPFSSLVEAFRAVLPFLND